MRWSAVVIVVLVGAILGSGVRTLSPAVAQVDPNAATRSVALLAVLFVTAPLFLLPGGGGGPPPPGGPPGRREPFLFPPHPGAIP